MTDSQARTDHAARLVRGEYLFEKAGRLERVAELAAAWFEHFL